jgi:thiosulfate dehydrogenase [quinone] large subunit
MLSAFLESIKYAGHLLPISFLRIYMGYYYLDVAINRYSGDFLIRPRLAAQVSEWLTNSHAPLWYKFFLENYFIPQWQIFAFMILALEFAIAISYLFGYLVRPMALIGVFMSLNILLLAAPGSEVLPKTFMAVHFTLAWLGAGRCLGLDYFFFKRRRGIWW